MISLDLQHAPHASGLPLWLRWVGANAIAEALGLGATLALDAAILSVIAAQHSVVATVLGIILVTATGVVEGTLVGLMQWSVLRHAFAGITWRAWLNATIVGAVIAWFLGSLPSTLMDMSAQQGDTTLQEPPALLVYALAAGMGLVLGPVLGVPQWLVLRQVTPRAWIWIPANCLAWAAGMALIFIAIDLAQLSGSLPGLIIGLGIGLLTVGAAVGAVHGIALVKLAHGHH